MRLSTTERSDASREHIAPLDAPIALGHGVLRDVLRQEDHGLKPRLRLL